MSLKTSTGMILPEPSEELISSEAFSMEAYANDLMDDLFSDLDNTLKEGKNLSRRTVKPQYFKKKDVKVPQIFAPETVKIVKSSEALNTNTSDVAVEKSHSKSSSRKIPNKTHIAWGKLLNRVASFGAIIAGVVWLGNSGLLNRLSSSSFQQALREPLTKEQVAKESPVDPQTDLVNYMLTALATINSEQSQNKQVSVQNLNSANLDSQNVLSNPLIAGNRASLPPVANASNALPPIPTRYTRVIERVKRKYVPVPYKAPEPMRYQPPSIPKVSQKPKPSSESNASSSKTDNTKVATATKAVRHAFAAIRSGIKPVNISKNPITAKQPSKPISSLLPSIPSIPTVSNSKQSAQQQTSVEEKQQNVTAAKTISKHELKAVMDWGDKSAAIFDVEGANLQVRKGETIGSSGWTLVDITGKEAIIRRNGEVRSIQAGQNI